LDALEPSVIAELLEEGVAKYTDEDRSQALIDLETEQKNSLAYISEHWQELDGENDEHDNS